MEEILKVTDLKRSMESGGPLRRPERGQLFPERRRICGHHGGLRLGQDHSAQLCLHHRPAHLRLILVDGKELSDLRGKELARFRRERLGFIFQDCNLLDTLTAFENIALALSIVRTPAGEIREQVEENARLLASRTVWTNTRISSPEAEAAGGDRGSDGHEAAVHYSG